ncbi:MAG: hypothetical protein WCI05_01860 [Myxococcales bacterium]
MSDASGWTAEQIWMNLLADEGYRPRVIDAGKVLTFKREGLNYLVLLDARDPEFLHLILPRCWPLESDVEFARAFRVVNKVHARIKVARILIDEDDRDISFGVELLVPNLNSLGTILPRVLSIIDSARRKFTTTMQEAAASEVQPCEDEPSSNRSDN